LGTWRIPGSNEVNQTDHLLVTSRYSSSVIDVTRCRGPNCDSDHYLVKIEVRERTTNVLKTQIRKTRRWDIEKLYKGIVQTAKYQKVLDLKLKQKTEEEEEEEGTEKVQKKWEYLEQAIKAMAEETTGGTKCKKNEEWFDEVCAIYIRDKNKARQKILQKETRYNYEEYQEWRRKTNRICKRKKRENMKKPLEEINQLNQRNERRKFYKLVNNMKRGFQPRMCGCKGNDGRMIGEEGKILERGTEHFTKLLNEDEEDKEDYKQNITAKLDHVLEQPQEICQERTRQEIRYAIRSIRNNTAPGEDTIVAELIKYGGEGVMDAIHKLIKLIWTTENMPWERNTGIICPIYKKGDKLECNKYRGITFLNNEYKIFSSILNERLKPATEKIIGDYRCGFCQNKSTID
jgi:hypothetical protein